MKAPISNSPQVVRKDGRLFFIESPKEGRRRAINLDRVDYIEFGDTFYYESETKDYAARLHFHDAKFHLFYGDDARALAGYFLKEKYLPTGSTFFSLEKNGIAILGDK